MENTEKLVTSEKLANSKEVIAYIAERFPKCFILEGEAKPLKIGIFQDLAERLHDDPKISKTQLRAGLRQYTSSWRYLHGVKPGASRIDLDGNPCGELEEEHIEHAKKALEESKAKVAARRKEQAKKVKTDSRLKRAAKATTLASTKKTKNVAPNKTKEQKPIETTRALNADEFIIGNNVSVNMGKGNMPATIVEVSKNDVRIRLSNGLQMVVKAENLRAL